MSGGGNIKPGSKRRRKACLELYETLRGGLELTENARSSEVDSPPFVNGQVAPVRELRSELKQVDGRAPGGSAMTLVSLGG